jgi:hypothetical protein
VRPELGLCNRLGVISSFAALARRSHREFSLCWSSGPGWSDEDLSDLFDNQVARVTEEEYAQACGEGLRLESQVTITGIGGLSEDWIYADGPGLAAVFDAARYPVITYSGFRRCQDLLAFEDRRHLLPGFEREFEAELRGWRPVEAIRDQVAQIASGFGDHTFGVHIRRGDAVRAPQVANQYRRSSDAAFVASMDRITRLRPRSSFFLATDCEATQQRFQERYGDRILTNPAKRFVPSIPGAAKANQRDAVIDLFALARTRTILGSYYSTFSKTAAAIGDVRVKVVLGDSRRERAFRLARFVRHEIQRRARSRIKRTSAGR